jgi:peptidoglycan/xylan/chitin deacetylase (PgdA/CDA1 family)
MELSVTMLPVFWDIDTLDWQSRNVSSILQIVNREIFDGAIILMHDAYSTSVEAALQIVDTLSAQGYEFVTVDRLLIS